MSATATAPQIHNRVQEFIGSARKMLIDGKWVPAASGKTFPVYNPATGEVMAQVAEGDREDIDRAVKAARRAFESGPWSTMTSSQRGRLIWKLADLMEEHLEEFAQMESLDNGKPLSVARVADVPLAIDLFRYMAGWATKIEGNTIPISAGVRKSSFLAYTRARTRRRRRTDHSLEFPAADGCVEARSGARHRLHHRAEAGRANAAERAAAGGAHHGSRHSRRRGQRRPRIRRDGRRRARFASRCRQGRLHRLDRSRQADRACGRRAI